MPDETDPRVSTRTWTRRRTFLVISGFILVCAVVSSVFWLPVLVGPDEEGVFTETMIE